MNQDLGFGPAVFGFGASVFFVGYMLLEVPQSHVALGRRARLVVTDTDELGRCRDLYGIHIEQLEFLYLALRARRC